MELLCSYYGTGLTQSEFASNLLRIVRDNLGQSIIGSDLSGDAKLLVFVIFFGSLEFAAIGAPYHDREDLIRIWFIKIEESLAGPLTSPHTAC